MTGPDPDTGDAPAGGRGPFERQLRPPPPDVPPPARYGRYVALLGLLILVLITVNTIATKPNGAKGVAPGVKLPPFAVPLATSNLSGYADVATEAGRGARHAACQLRGPRILNVCQLYEHAPLVLALFVEAGSCSAVLSDLQRLAAEFPKVNFAAVALRGNHGGTLRVIRSRRVTFPVGIDEGGVLAGLYKVASCPQITFASAGGTGQGKPILGRPSRATLRARVQALADAASAATGPGAGGPGVTGPGASGPGAAKASP